jgi:cytochrome c556
MRVASFTLAAGLVLLSGCGGPKTSQGNNAQANISNDARDVNQATGSNLEARLSLGDAAKVMHVRHEGMETIGKNFKVLTRQLGGRPPDLATVRASAVTINRLAQQASAWFPEGTGPDIAKTGARPEIWLPRNKADFAAKLHNFQVAAPRFSSAAAGNDLNATKARFAELSGTCKACHDKYRMDMHH